MSQNSKVGYFWHQRLNNLIKSKRGFFFKKLIHVFRCYEELLFISKVLLDDYKGYFSLFYMLRWFGFRSEILVINHFSRDLTII